MIDLNTILTQALTTAIATMLDEQIKPLVDRITALESQADEDMARIAVLEERVENRDALLKDLTARATDDTTANSNYPHGDGQRTEDLIAKAVHDAIEAHMENIYHMTEGDVGQIADDRLQDHCNDYDHDQFITEIDEDTVSDVVRECLRGATIRLD